MKDKDALIQPDRGQEAISIRLVDKAGLDVWREGLTVQQRSLADAGDFKGAGGEMLILPERDGWSVAAGIADASKPASWCLASLADKLPEGVYRLAEGSAPPDAALLGWVLAQHRFDRYRSEPKPLRRRVLHTSAVKAIAPALAEARATALVRDLVNTPAEHLGPAALEDAARALARSANVELRVTSGEALEREYPMIHAVGRAASRQHAPRLIELEWGKAEHPRLAIIGKGVCFDSGGLDIKPASGMALMKKDMGGAAHALALAGLVIEAGLKVRLHLLIPAVENAISGNAMRPGDVLTSRKGLQVEIGNTDAEGRLVLGDALARASEDSPALIIDFATLTGAARTALGPDLPAMFARHDSTAAALAEAGHAVDDPLWRLPLWEGYRDYLASDIADFNNSSSNGFAGAIVGALFLDRFVPAEADWVHFDTFSWRATNRPGRPKGGDALGLRASWRMLQTRFG